MLFFVYAELTVTWLDVHMIALIFEATSRSERVHLPQSDVPAMRTTSGVPGGLPAPVGSDPTRLRWLISSWLSAGRLGGSAGCNAIWRYS